MFLVLETRKSHQYRNFSLLLCADRKEILKVCLHLHPRRNLLRCGHSSKFLMYLKEVCDSIGYIGGREGRLVGVGEGG